VRATVSREAGALDQGPSSIPVDDLTAVVYGPIGGGQIFLRIFEIGHGACRAGARHRDAVNP